MALVLVALDVYKQNPLPLDPAAGTVVGVLEVGLEVVLFFLTRKHVVNTLTIRQPCLKQLFFKTMRVHL